MYRHLLVQHFRELLEGCSPLEIESLFQELVLDRRGTVRRPWFDVLFTTQLNALRALGIAPGLVDALEAKREAVIAHAVERIAPGPARSINAYRLPFCPVLPQACLDYPRQIAALRLGDKEGFYGIRGTGTLLEPSDVPAQPYYIFDVAYVRVERGGPRAQAGKNPRASMTAAETIAVLRHMVVGKARYAGSANLICGDTRIGPVDQDGRPVQISTIDDAYALYPADLDDDGSEYLNSALGRLSERI